MWRKSGALQGESSEGPTSAGLGTSAPVGLVHAATQTDTVRQLDVGAAQMNSNQNKQKTTISLRKR